MRRIQNHKKKKWHKKTASVSSKSIFQHLENKLKNIWVHKQLLNSIQICESNLCHNLIYCLKEYKNWIKRYR